MPVERKLKRGDRVRAGRTLRDRGRRHTIYRNTEGTVLGRYCDMATVLWDDKSIFRVVPLAALARPIFLHPPAVRSQGSLPELTRARLLQFESIQDLLIALGHADRHDARAMINPITTHVIGYGKIAGRSVAEFVNWGERAGWLCAHVKAGEASTLTTASGS